MVMEVIVFCDLSTMLHMCVCVSSLTAPPNAIVVVVVAVVVHDQWQQQQQ